MNTIVYDVTEQAGVETTFLELYLRGTRFESQLGHQASWLRFSWFSHGKWRATTSFQIKSSCYPMIPCYTVVDEEQQGQT
jgi:hypothetical protein